MILVQKIQIAVDSFYSTTILLSNMLVIKYVINIYYNMFYLKSNEIDTFTYLILKCIQY